MSIWKHLKIGALREPIKKCIGYSHPLPKHIAEPVDENELVVACVLSGNKNFEARVNPQEKMNFLMSPMLVVAMLSWARWILILSMVVPSGCDPNRLPVYLKDIWPTQEVIFQTIKESRKVEDFKYARASASRLKGAYARKV